MRIIAGLMALSLSGCSFFAYGRPVVVLPPGTRDPATTVGATVRCYQRGWPVTVDAVAAGVSQTYAANALLLFSLLIAFTGQTPEFEPSLAAVLLLPSAVLLTSTAYGGSRLRQCGRALQASARAKLRGVPLRLEDVRYEVAAPASASDHEKPPAGPPPAGPPSTTAPLPTP